MQPEKDNSNVDEMIRVIKHNNGAILELFRAVSNSQSIQNRLILEFIEDMRAYRASREKIEGKSTEEKINEAVRGESMFLWFRDKIIPGIVIVVLLKVLELL